MAGSGTVLRAWLALAMVGIGGAACGSDDPKMSADDGGKTPPVDGGGVETPNDANVGDAAPSDGSATTDAKVTDTGVFQGTAPVLASAMVRQSGRFGHDLRIDVISTDVDGDVAAVRVEALSADGKTVPAGAAPVSAPLMGTLDKTANAAANASIALLHRSSPGIRRARVVLVDGVGNVSNPIEVDVGVQTVAALNQPCDNSYLTSRCADGLGCKGTLPASCQPGEKPIITNAGYYDDELGPRVLIEGTDPDDDVSSYAIEFLDLDEQPVLIDLDGELGDKAPASSFTTTVDVTAGSGKFFFRFEPTEFFIETVKAVRLTVSDLGNNKSDGIKKTLNDMDGNPASTGAPSIARNQKCDTRGFNRCAAADVCALEKPTAASTTCVAVATARGNACKAALVLNPSMGVTQVRGTISDPSLWDAPEGCSSNNPKRQLDTVVKLTLTKPATKVVLSTDSPFTSFDTTLYALTSCTAVPMDVWCADDQGGTSPTKDLAVLELIGSPTLPAQDYYIVVDSFLSSDQRSFQLTATVTE